MNTDERNSTIMEFACDLANLALIEKYELFSPQLMNKNGEGYKEEYQDEFDELYDKYSEQLSNI